MADYDEYGNALPPPMYQDEYGHHGHPQDYHHQEDYGHGYADDAPYGVDAGQSLPKASRNAHIKDGRYLCGRCGEANISTECKQCRCFYCDACASILHSEGSYQAHQLVAFDPHYEGNKRATKRGTKYDTTAPQIRLLVPGNGLQHLPLPSIIATILLIIVIILGIIACIVPGWTRCKHEPESWHIGPFRTAHDGDSEGTLYMWEPLPCPHDKFKVPVNFARVFVVGALFYALAGVILLIAGQAGVWRTIILVKASAFCCIVSCILFLLSASVWAFASVGDVTCTAAVVPINPYGPAGWCVFNYGWYFIWICALLTFVAGGIILDWWAGLPILAKVALVLLLIIQMLVVAALLSNYWMKGELQSTTAQPNNVTTKVETWGGLWRNCAGQEEDAVPGVTGLTRQCQTVAEWKVEGSRDCMKKSMYYSVRGLTIFSAVLSVLIYILVLAAHAYRRAKLTKVASIIAFLMVFFWSIALVVWAVRINSKHKCKAGTIERYDHHPFCNPDSCSLAWSWFLLLAATILSLILTILLFLMRVGFEQNQYLDENPRSRPIKDKPATVAPSAPPADDYYHNQDPLYYDEPLPPQ